jgi:hypothetical protein
MPYMNLRIEPGRDGGRLQLGVPCATDYAADPRFSRIT